MTVHISARLAWHDRGWDAHVCDAPHLNTSCIAQRHIRERRNTAKERRAAGGAFPRLPGWLPPCARDAGAYATHRYVITHRDPLEYRDLPPVEEEVAPYSCFPSPYRWMREENFQDVCLAEGLSIRQAEQPKENGWVVEADRQRELLKQFWQNLTPKQSLIFYYCNQGNPVDEATARLIVGVGRLAELGPQLYFGTKAGFSEPYPVWSRRVTQDYPFQGVRLPYQEYLRAGHAPDAIACRVPPSAMLPFSYVGEHVSDDLAVGILERVIQAVEQVRAQGYVAGDWEARLVWLNDVLAEVWAGRGSFPGLGSVLQYLGFDTGTAYQRAILAPLARRGTNPWDHTLALLEGRSEPEDGPSRRGLLAARARWRLLPATRRTLLAELARYELAPSQVRRIADPDQRAASGLARDGVAFTDAALVANPYLIAEFDLGAKQSAPVALETLDHGMRPAGNATRFPKAEPVAQDDRRRVRAVAQDVLEEAASNGDTLLTLAALLDGIGRRFPERRACRPDRDVMMAEADFHRAVLWMAYEHDPALVALGRLRRLEEETAGMIRRRAAKVNTPPEGGVTWRAPLEGLFGHPRTERERAALGEKSAALDTLLARRLSVLTGGAGTGKTSVLRILLAELERLEGKEPCLLLAPTGKARVRLAAKTGRSAQTIHQFLLKQGWLQPESFALKETSNQKQYRAATVLIDECSMIPADLFGTVLRALDMGPLRRLILVGDPSQLPPIGPGRPFVDIIEWLNKEHADCVAALQVCMRTDEAEGRPEDESVALALAEGYRADAPAPGDDEILAAVARGESRGDLEVVFWRDQDDLLAKLKASMAAHLGCGPKDYAGFNRSLGIGGEPRDGEPWGRSEAWQILSPTRVHYFGADEVNRQIQREYRGRLIAGAYASARTRGGGRPRPFGNAEIVYTEKVIQLANRRIQAWPRNAGIDYVANGEIGIVRETRKGSYQADDSLDVAFSTQPEVTYRYARGQVDENLELAYALTVHKAQGSDFDIVFLILPQTATTHSRELIYTGLTRFRTRLVLLLERDIGPLLRLRSLEHSDTRLRNTGSCPYPVLRKRVASGRTTEARAACVVTRSRFTGASPCASRPSLPPSFRIWPPSTWSTSH